MSDDLFTIDTGEYLVEMAKINPPLHRKILDTTGFIYVSVPQGSEDSVPHLHVYLDKSINDKNCSFIRLDKAEYSPHHDIIKLSRKLVDSFMSIMTGIWSKHYVREKDGTIRSATGYEAAVDIWIDTHGIDDGITFEIDESTGIWIMPPYQDLFYG